jgi:hypothetical protein
MARQGHEDAWTCAGCGYAAAGRPPSLEELIGTREGFGDWDDVDIAAYATKITALVLVGADQLNPSAARTIGLIFMGHYPTMTQKLMPMMGELSAELAAISRGVTSSTQDDHHE